MTVDWDALNPGEDSPHLAVYHETIWADEYRLDGRIGLRTIVDLGANVGYFAIKAAEMFPEARVFSYEADPANVAAALALIPHIPHYVGVRITMHNEAIWSSRGMVELASDRAGLSWVVADEREASRTIPVPSVTLDEALMNLPEVDLLKMDIEGAEYAVIEAASDDTLAKVRSIAMEVHTWSGGPKSRPEFYEKLERYFLLEGVREGSGMLYGTRR